MKTNRQYNQIIDLEYYVHQDSATESNKLHQRDRNIFLQNRKQLKNEDQATNGELIRLWVAERNKKEFSAPDKKSPGTIFGDVYLLARNLAAIIGILIGLTGGFSFFTYTGSTPVNVFHFLLLFVFTQLSLVGLLIFAWLLHPLPSRLKPPSFYSLLFKGMLIRLVTFLHKKWLQKMAGDQRSSVSHAFGIFKARGTVYGSLFYWPLFALSQLFAIGFNIGLLSATLLKITTSDIAFGWQSTIQFSAEAIHRAVMIAALPWSWFVPQTSSYPSLAEIEGSRIILKEGIYHLTTTNLIAWWPFLVFCLLFYGLFLRLTLFFAGKLLERHAFRKLQFDTPACLSLIRRMKTPLVTTQAAPEQKAASAENPVGQQSGTGISTAPNLLEQVVLIPEEISSFCPAEKLEALLLRRGMAIKDMLSFMISYDEDRQILQLLAERHWHTGEGVFILMEGWMVPLVDFLSFLKELRQILPNNSIIQVGLVGRPDATGLTPVSAEDFTLWRRKIEAAGDPYLTIFSLLP